MKKMNNKGFAISTLIYGLLLVAFLVVALLMSVMSTNRRNTSTLVKKIEEELNRFSQTTTEITSTGSSQEFIVPYGKAGWYKIELWGASAKSNYIETDESSSVGRGSYTSGVIYLEENQHLYFHIGAVGGKTPSERYNGSNQTVGGATDVRTEPGDWADEASKNSRIMVAGGGGKRHNVGAGYDGGLEIDYSGGSYISGYGVQPSVSGYSFINTIIYSGVNAGTGKAKIELVSTNSKDNPPSTRTKNLNTVRYIRDCIYVNSTPNRKEHWLELQAYTADGLNVAYGKSAIYTTSNTNISEITDGTLEIITTRYTNRSEGAKCIVVDLGSVYNLEEIIIHHLLYSPDDSSYDTETISVSSNDSTYKEVKKWNNADYAVEETSEGIRISDRHVEKTDTVPSGNYYIQSALSQNRVIGESGSNALIQLFTGNPTQKWAITQTSSGNYKIVEGSAFKALQPQEGATHDGELVGAPSEYANQNGTQEWQEWKIVPIESSTTSNGYYQFKSKQKNTLCLATSSSEKNRSGTLELKTCNSKDKTQWFKLKNADY